MVISAVAVCSVIAGGAVFSGSRFNALPHLVSSLTPPRHTQFPQIDSSRLTVTQQKIVSLLKQEYESQPPGTKYSEGVSEPWCADFVSWIYKQAGMPFVNPNSGSWRIPGTVTLREYYQSMGKFRAAGSGYAPRVGDIILYDNPSPFGQHTNIVVSNDGGIITTVGGNEPGGIRVFVHETPDKAGFIGYGALN